ncbi:MAG TPA: PAS domain S-box protein [Gaiellaceae bacterium]|jgi:PAS domain S-box-containing protein|nr:PAS domain S-box protein [Gaiellaceae bacterium]
MARSRTSRRRTAKSAASLKARISALERECELLNAVANYAPSLLCLIDGDGRVRPRAANKAFERTLGYAAAEIGGTLFWERFVPDGERAAARDCIEAAVRSGSITEREGRWLQRDGGEIDVAWSCTPLPKVESGPVWLVTGTDITDRKRHEAEVRRSRARIVAAADDARRRLERNLHDGAQQRLIALLLQLRGAQRGGLEPAAAVETAVGELAAAVKELRELAQGIHPSALGERGLAAALRIVAARAPIPVELDVTDTPLETNVAVAAYYIVSESLNNVAKYAEATRAAVRVRETERAVVVVVEDDGRGGADATLGTGLAGLADRAAALEGTLTLDSPPGGGTRVRAELPIECPDGHR